MKLLAPTQRKLNFTKVTICQYVEPDSYIKSKTEFAALNHDLAGAICAKSCRSASSCASSAVSFDPYFGSSILGQKHLQALV